MVFNRRQHRGLSLIEVLLAISLSAILLLAAAHGLRATIQSYQTNQQYVVMTTRARVAMQRMTALLREAPEAQPSTENKYVDFKKGGQIDPATNERTGYVDDIGFKIIDKGRGNSHAGVIFEWDAATHELRMRRDVPGPLKWSVIAHGIANFNVRLRAMQSTEAMRSHGAGMLFDQVEEATITMTLEPTGADKSQRMGRGGEELTTVVSVVPRQIIWNGPRLPVNIDVLLAP